MMDGRQMTTDNSVGGNFKNYGHSENTTAMRPISMGAWLILGLSTLATFIGFITLDPDPSLLLSACAAVNVAIMLWAMYRLYQWDLLLSPMMIIFVGPAMITYYSWGNLGARIAGEARFAVNYRTLEYYPFVALLSTLGLLLYCLTVFGVFRKSFRRIAIKYQDLYWRPQQIIVVISLGLAILLYLSIKYSFISGYFTGAESNFDRWLIASLNGFVFLVIIVSVSVLARAVDYPSRLIASSGVLLAIVLALGLRSRTFMVMALILIALCWLTLKPEQARLSFFLKLGLVGVVVFVLGSAIKSLQDETTSIFDNLYAVSSLESSQILGRTINNIEIDRQYRVGGFEYPAAILRCFDNGAVPAYGKGLMGAAIQGLPGFLRPAGIFNERSDIMLHFLRYCFFYGDSMAIPLVSGLGDWGMPGLLIYIFFGVFSLLLWRVAQGSPRLFMAYLLVPYFPDNLFWEGVFTYVKVMAFLWLILWILGPLLMPRWQPSIATPNSTEHSNTTN